MTDAHHTRRWVLGLAAVASFMVALDTLVVSTALTTIRLDLGASVEELEWTVNAYNLSFAVLLMTGVARSATASDGGGCSRRASCSSRSRRPPARSRPTRAR